MLSTRMTIIAFLGYAVALSFLIHALPGGDPVPYDSKDQARRGGHGAGSGHDQSEDSDDGHECCAASADRVRISRSLKLYELARIPSLQERVRQELVGERSLPSFEDRSAGKASLLDAVLKEVPRCRTF